MPEVPGPSKDNLSGEESESGSKRRKVQKEAQALSREERNEILKCQKNPFLTGI